jgi:hypothetical protein
MKHWCNDVDKTNRSTPIETYFNVILSIINRKSTTLGSNPGLGVDRLLNNHLSYDTASLE